MFKAILIEKDDAGYRAELKKLDDAQLPEGEGAGGIQHA